MNKSKSRIIFVAILVILVVAISALQLVMKPKKSVSIKKETVSIKEEKSENTDAKTENKESNEASDEASDEAWMTKSQIKEYQNQPNDNQGKKDAALTITFTGYEENPEAFSWMGRKEWEKMQESLQRYLEEKGFQNVTEVNLHPDSIQKINDYERYVYIDINHKNAYTDKIVLKAICETYKDVMRFAFNVQYGS